MNNLCIIPARGGSKRIPRKNIKDFFGKPIVAYSIEAAIKSELFSEVMVSTDDEEIKEIASTYGAKTPFERSEATSNDLATLTDVISEVLNGYKKENKSFDAICCILPTAPFLRIERLMEAYNLLTNRRFHSVFPVCEYPFPIQRSLLKDEDNKVKMAWPEHMFTRSQDLTKHYYDCGQFYWIRRDKFEEEKTLYTSNSGVIELPQLEVQDIDTLDDWKVAEVKYRLLHDE